MRDLAIGTEAPMTIREQVAERIRREIPHARVEIVDLTGTDDHFEARVVSSAFAGKSPIERHRMVYRPLREWIEDDTVHAISVRAWTPEQYDAASGRRVERCDPK